MSRLGGSRVRRPRPRSDRHRLAAKGIIALVMMLLLALPPRHADAEIFAGIAIVSSVLSTLISLGDSGANPYNEMTSQIHESMKILHKRLNGYDRAFKAILQRLDALPKEIRKEIDAAFVDERITQVRSAISLIVEDIKVFKKLQSKQKQLGGLNLTPIADASARLTHLQNTVSDLIQADDDLIVFDLIAARYVEHAVIAMQKGHEADADWSVRKERYQKRFERMLSNQWRKDSLPWRYFVAENNGNSYLEIWRTHEVELAIENLYKESRRQITNCELQVTYTITDAAKTIQKNMNSVDLLGTNRLKLIRSYDTLRSFYKYTISIVQYELAVLVHETSPAMEYPTLILFDDYERRFIALRDRINNAVSNIPSDNLLFARPHGQQCM